MPSPEIKVWRPIADLPVDLMRFDDLKRPSPRTVNATFILTVILSGTVRFTNGTDRYTAQAETLLLTQPGETRLWLPDAASGFSGRNFHLSPEQFQTYTKAVPRFSDPVITDNELRIRLARLHRQTEIDRLPRLQFETLLMEWVGDLTARHAENRSTLSSQSVGKENAAVRRVRDYLHENAHRNCSLSEIGAVARLSPFHLSRVFRQSVGMPPHIYQIHRRIELAKTLLLQGIPAVDVALRCGFFDQNHLTRHFKRLVGTTPALYQRNSKIVLSDKRTFER